MSNNQTQHPSKKRLLKAMAIAVAVACILLSTIVLPAEYGIDPTGLGAKLGLVKPAESIALQSPAEKPEAMVETKSTVEEPAADTGLDAVGQPLKPVDGSVVTKHDGDYRTETMTVTIEPKKGAEIKARMNRGESFVFSWSVTGGEVASDFHGDKLDAAEGEYTSYWIDPAKANASGAFTAPFDGKHGWYWLNRGDKPVTVTVKVSGFYENLFRP